MTITISRKHAAGVVTCLAGAALLLFFAGSLTGMLYSMSQFSSVEQAQLASSAQHTKPGAFAKKVALAKGAAPVSSAGQPPANANAAGGASDTSAPAQTATAKPAPGVPEGLPTASFNSADPNGAGSLAQAATSAPGASQASQAASTTQATQAAETGGSGNASGAGAGADVVSASYAIPLEVQVGSFRLKAHAAALTQSLKSLGYSPSTSLFTDAEGRVWYVVRLGPYTRWDEATRMATQVSLAENVSPMIGPMQ